MDVTAGVGEQATLLPTSPRTDAVKGRNADAYSTDGPHVHRRTGAVARVVAVASLMGFVSVGVVMYRGAGGVLTARHSSAVAKSTGKKPTRVGPCTQQHLENAAQSCGISLRLALNYPTRTCTYSPVADTV